MAPSSSSSSSSSKSPTPPLHQSFHFTPIQECEEEEYNEERFRNRATPSSDRASSATPNHHQYHHQPTPLHHKKGKQSNKKGHEVSSDDDETDGSVSCSKCRPNHSHRDKISVVPIENNNSSFVSPNGKIRSIFQTLTWKSPKPAVPPPASREEQWKITVAELSQKLIQATRKKEEALLEASRLKHSMSELEKKLNKLEIYCHNLKFGLDECSNKKQSIKIEENGLSSTGFKDRAIQQFLICVSDSRSCIRVLSRSLASQLRNVGGKVYERLSLLLQPFDVKINSFAKNPKSLVLYLEALLSRAFFEDFESPGFQKNGSTGILNPIDRCEANYASFNDLMGLTWDEVLSRGTKHFSEEFSGFCDRKMSEVVAMLGWNRAWPEPLLQAFFGASKSAWLVHLLANSVNPGLQIFRVEKAVRFDPVYMEDMGGDRVKTHVPTSVRVMVQPGFYVYGSVVKCKVLCRYCDGVGNPESDSGDVKGLNSGLG